MLYVSSSMAMGYLDKGVWICSCFRRFGDEFKVFKPLKSPPAIAFLSYSSDLVSMLY